MVVRELIVKIRMAMDKGSASAATASINSTKGALSTMAASGSRAGASVSRGLATIRNGAAQAAEGIGMIRNSINGLMGMLGPLAGAMAAAFTVTSIKSAADEMMNLDGRLRTVTNSEQERYGLEDQLYALSQNNRQSLSSIGDLYYKVARGAKQFGVSQEDAMRVTDVVSKALTVGNASATEAQASILQLGQALSSGVLQGDELHSLDENASLLMQHIADNMGVTIGDLKKMGSAGELTSTAVIQAILASGAAIDGEFGQMQMTIGQSLTMVGSAWDFATMRIQRRTQVFSRIAQSIVGVMQDVESTFNTFMDLSAGPKSNSSEDQQAYANLQAQHPILVAILGVITAIGEGISFIENLLGTSNIVAKFIMIAAAVMIVGSVLGLIGSAISSVIGGVSGLYTVFAAIFGIITAIGWPIVAVFAAIAAAIYYVRNNWDEVVAAFKPGLSRIMNGLQSLQEAWIAIQPLIQALIPILQVVANIVGAVIVAAILYLWNIATTAFEAVAAVINGVATVLGKVGELIQWCADGLASLINKGKEFLGMQGQFDASGSALEGEANRIININNNQTNNFAPTDNQGDVASAAYPAPVGVSGYW